MEAMHNTIDQDTISRNRIVSETDMNFFVEAGAGSGKTTMLVNRMVAMVEQGKDIGKICAITFTKNAAGEFYDRFQKLLVERSNPDHVYESKGYAGELPAPTDETRARCAYALQHIDLCFMGTIDSFCNMILSEHPTEAGIPSDAALISDADALTIYKQEYVKICDGVYGDELKSMASAFRGMHNQPEKVFEATMGLVMKHRDAHFHFGNAESDIDEQFKSKRIELIEAVDQLLKHPEAKYPKEKNNLAAWDRLQISSRAIHSRWSKNYANVNAALKSLKSLRLCIPCEDIRLSKGSIFDDHYSRKKYAWTELTIGEEGGLVEQFSSLQYNVTMSFITACLPVMEQIMLEKGAMTYFDYLYYLRNVLAKDAAEEGLLIDYIYNRHSYFLIDEFQDTNPLQSEIFFYLTAKKPLPRWQDCCPREGSLFIVGDPKQSIYRFRSADVTSFLKVKDLFVRNGGDILTLTRNFRSTKDLCGYFNLQFEQLFPEKESEIQSTYQPIPLVQDSRNDVFEGRYYYEAFVEGKGASEYPDQTEEKVVASLIKRLVNNPAHMIMGKEDKQPREIRYSDFMLISAVKRKLTGFMEEFKKQGIPTRVEGKVPFESTMALAAICQIYAAVCDVDDQMALYGALNGTLYGHTKEELRLYKKAGYKISLKGKCDIADKLDTFSDKEQSILLDIQKSVSELQDLSVKAKGMSPAALYAQIMDQYEIFRKVDTDNLEVVYYTLEFLRANEKTGLIVSHKDAAMYLEKMLTGDADEERVLSLREQTDAVHLANLHKVKGLEAPIVILVHSKKPTLKPSIRIEHNDDGTEGYLIAVEDENYFPLMSAKNFKDQIDYEKDALACENDRLIYVAATRARNALLICKGLKMSEDGDISEVSSKWDPLMSESVKDILVYTQDNPVREPEEVIEISADHLYEKADELSVLTNKNVEEMTYEVRKPSADKVASKIDESEPDEPAEVTETEEKTKSVSVLHRFPTLLGTMTHRVMEMLVSAKNQIEAGSMVAEIVKEYATPQIVLYEKELRDALLMVADTMRSGGYMQENEAPVDLLTELLGAEEVYCEVPFCYQDNAGDIPVIWNGVMDVIYKNANGWHIVDYKTNADGGHLDLKYESQMKAYEAAFLTMTGENAKALTYHIGI